MSGPPAEIAGLLSRARRIEWLTLFWQATIVVVMFLVMGSSAAMKTAWVEDILGLVPAAVFLIALRFEKRGPTERFPYGYSRTGSLAFLIAAAALLSMGAFLIYDAVLKLLHAEHPTIGAAPLFGPDLWLGWLMVAALVYSIVPPVILGRMKLPVARALQDKVLHTDAQMQKADWQTGVAAVLGVVGVGFGLWWADSASALVIALSIVRDGKRAVSIATAELIDGAPRALDADDLADDARALQGTLRRRYPDGRVRLRESGRYILAQVDGSDRGPVDLDELWPGDPDRRWRLGGLSVTKARRDD